MSKFKTLKSRISTLDIRKGKSPVVERTRGSEHKKIRTRILIRDNFTCQICKNDYIDSFLKIDHIIPLHLGGAEIDDNRQCLCLNCHKIKSDKEEKERRGAD